MTNKETLKKAEELLIEYPTLFKRIALREEYIANMAYVFAEKIGRSWSDLNNTVEARKEKDPEYTFLKNRITWIRKAFMQLPDELRKLISLYYFEGLPRESVMKEMGISEREFYRRKQQALEEFAKNLEISKFLNTKGSGKSGKKSKRTYRGI